MTIDPDVQAVMIVLAWIAGWVLLWRVPRPPVESGPCPPTTVMIPARDEEESLPNLLEALASDPNPFDVVVVDDSSIDRTAAIAAEHGATVISPPLRPPDWTPKNWALHWGMSSTRDPVSPTVVGHDPGVVVFVDADVRPTPGLVADVARRAAAVDGLISIQPYQVTERAYEQLIAPFALVSMMGVGAGSVGARLDARGAFGPVMATTRAAYDAVGGHAAVSDDVVEDMALADRYRRSGRPVEVYGGHDRVGFRMYPGGFRQLIQGWAKNMASGSGRIPLWRTVALVAWIAAGLRAAILLFGAGLEGEVGLGAALTFGFAAQIHHHQRQLGDFRWWTPILYPVGFTFFVALFVYSAYRINLRRSVRWRGREIELSRS